MAIQPRGRRAGIGSWFGHLRRATQTEKYVCAHWRTLPSAGPVALNRETVTTRFPIFSGGALACGPHAFFFLFLWELDPCRRAGGANREIKNGPPRRDAHLPPVSP